MDRQVDILRQALVDCRWHSMRLLADEAEERGDLVMAKGWRWLADNRKWPGTRTPPRERRQAIIGGIRYYGWSLRKGSHLDYEDTLPSEITAEFFGQVTGGLWSLLTMAALYVGKRLDRGQRVV